MILYSEFKASMQSILEDDSTETAASLVYWTRLAMDWITKSYNFKELWATLDLTPDANGLITMPALMQREHSIMTTDRKSRFMLLFGDRSLENNRLSRCFYRPGGVRRVASGTLTGCTVIQEDATVTKTGGFASGVAVGQAIQIAGISEYFEVSEVTDANNIEIYPAYPGASGAVTVYKAPAGVKQYYLLDTDDTAYASAVTCDYQMRHPAIIDTAACMILLDIEQSLTLKVLQWAMLNGKYDVDAQRLDMQIEKALRAEISTAGAGQAQFVPSGINDVFNPYAMRSKRIRSNSSVTR